ncbi:hypothetical protein O181_079940 [Austropuccinia psidii MF-1]|uniref:Uncharacterized protein n=1 Tax=Austropuccinia psidii MF-1 TaxID=1389203 RepID=A0A9Q3FFY3_9BASI|nr:hypothetical protein [Austropuccinia psidii MF-1]
MIKIQEKKKPWEIVHMDCVTAIPPGGDRSFSFKYSKERWDKSHKPPDVKVGDLVLVSILNLNSIKGPKKLGYSFSGTLIMKSLHGPNAAQLDLTG